MISAHQCAEVPQNSYEKAEISTSWLIYISGERKKKNPQKFKAFYRGPSNEKDDLL